MSTTDKLQAVLLAVAVVMVLFLVATLAASLYHTSQRAPVPGIDTPRDMTPEERAMLDPLTMPAVPAESELDPRN